jgi:hypothetical protein
LGTKLPSRTGVVAVLAAAAAVPVALAVALAVDAGAGAVAATERASPLGEVVRDRQKLARSTAAGTELQPPPEKLLARRQSAGDETPRGLDKPWRWAAAAAEAPVEHSTVAEAAVEGRRPSTTAVARIGDIEMEQAADWWWYMAERLAVVRTIGRPGWPWTTDERALDDDEELSKNSVKTEPTRPHYKSRDSQTAGYICPADTGA